MPTEIYLVKVGMTMTEGTVEEWYVADGATVEPGDLLYRLETEKVNLDVDAEIAGIVRHLVGDGTTLEPGEVVGLIYAPGEEIPDTLPAAKPLSADAAPVSSEAKPTTDLPGANPDGNRVAASPAAKRLARELSVDLASLTGSGPRGRITESDVQAGAEAAKSAPPPSSGGGTRTPSSPVARKLAEELGVDITLVEGTGPRGRITKDDVERAAAAPAQAAPGATVDVPDTPDSIPMRGIRKTIAEHMFSSLHETAQLTLDMEVAMDDVVKLRTQLVTEWENEALRVTYTDIVVAAATKALLAHPNMNSAIAQDEIRLFRSVHMGIAVALEDGLIVPVIHNAHDKDLKSIAIESARLAQAARAGSLTLDDIQGGTFTVTSLGMYGVDTFTPILNAPQSGILGVGRIYEGLRWEGEAPVKAAMMRLSLTWDHRALDGAPAAEFLATVREYLEAPYRLLV
ncbi:MAG: 2-oxo acid dehydrogenase subunit E2 [Gammaproteobacteria bacterium]|nr:2-oxo acid dehydrogenase subunit E2 [Gammaproteobacteria bacterium]